MMRAIEDTLRDQDAVPRQFSSHRAIEASLALVLKPYREDPIVGKFITALTRGAIVADRKPAPPAGASAPAPSGTAAPKRMPPQAAKTTKQQRAHPLDEIEESASPISMEQGEAEGDIDHVPKVPRSTYLTILAERMGKTGYITEQQRTTLSSTYARVARDGSANDRRIGEAFMAALNAHPAAVKIVPSMFPTTHPSPGLGQERKMPDRAVNYLHPHCGRCQLYRARGPFNSKGELFDNTTNMFEVALVHVIDNISMSAEDREQLHHDYEGIGIISSMWTYP